MNPRLVLRSARCFAAIIGTMDTFTGLALVTFPARTLALMGAAVPGNEALGFVRFIGVFVAAVGASYLVALARRSPAQLRAVFQFTLLFRGGAGIYCAVAVMTGHFDSAWWVVAATDLTCAAVQLFFLAKGAGCDA